MGCDAKMDDKKNIKEFDDQLAEVRAKGREVMVRLYEKRNAKLPSIPIEQPVSEHFNIYVYPKVKKQNASDSDSERISRPDNPIDASIHFSTDRSHRS